MVDVQNLFTAIDILSIKAANLQIILQCLIRSLCLYYNKIRLGWQADFTQKRGLSSGSHSPREPFVA